MHLVYPKILWALLLLLPLIAFYILTLSKRHATLSLPTLYRLQGGGLRVYLRHLPYALEVAALGLLIVALARPQDSHSWNKEAIEGIDIMLCLDASGSMLAEDLQPNRFMAARQVAADFISDRPNDNIGLVIFAGESFTQCPLTTDHPTLLSRLEESELGILGDGTAIGMGLATALNRLKASTTKSRVVVLLTDGTNNAGSITPAMAASIAAGLGIRIYTVAVGTHGTAPFPHQTPFGVVMEQVKVEIDEVSLQQIATSTGGQYFRATDNSSLKSIYEEIDQLEKSRLKNQSFTAYEEHFPKLLWVVVWLLILSSALRSTILRTNP